MPVGLACARRCRTPAPPPGTPRRGPVPPTTPPPASTGRRGARRTTVPVRLSTRRTRDRQRRQQLELHARVVFDDGTSRTAACRSGDPARRGSASRSAFSRTPASVSPSARDDELIVEQAEAVQRPERMHPAEGDAPCARAPRASARSAAAADRAAGAAPCGATTGCCATAPRPALGRSPCSGVAPPPAGRRVRHDPVDAPTIAAKRELRGVLVELAGRPLRVLDAGR